MTVRSRSLATAPILRAQVAAFNARRSTVSLRDRAPANASGAGEGRPTRACSHAPRRWPSRARAQVPRESACRSDFLQKTVCQEVPGLSRVAAGGSFDQPGSSGVDDGDDFARGTLAERSGSWCSARLSSASRARFSRSARSPNVLAASRRCAFSSSSCRIRARQSPSALDASGSTTAPPPMRMILATRPSQVVQLVLMSGLISSQPKRGPPLTNTTSISAPPVTGL